MHMAAFWRQMKRRFKVNLRLQQIAPVDQRDSQIVMVFTRFGYMLQLSQPLLAHAHMQPGGVSELR